jgi:hypothetical protein
VSFHSRQGMGSAGDGAEGMPPDAWEENSALEIGTLRLRLSHPVDLSARTTNRSMTPEPFPHPCLPRPNDRRCPNGYLGGGLVTGEMPLVRTAVRSLELSASIEFVVYKIRRTSPENA